MPASFSGAKVSGIVGGGCTGVERLAEEEEGAVFLEEQPGVQGREPPPGEDDANAPRCDAPGECPESDGAVAHSEEGGQFGGRVCDWKQEEQEGSAQPCRDSHCGNEGPGKWARAGAGAGTRAGAGTGARYESTKRGRME